MQKKVRCCLTFIQRRRGFLILEVLLGFVVVGIALMVFSARVTQMFYAWQRMETDTELFDAGRYMLTKLEREISVSGVAVQVEAFRELHIITENGKRELDIYSKPIVTYGVEQGLYQRTTTNSGSGVNPVFIRDCFVDNWRVEKISNKEVFVSFDLYKQGRRKTFERIFYCVNGEVSDAT